MTTCKVCFADNVSGALQCRNCNQPLTSTGQLCPKGHEIDPTWNECQYCRAEQQFGGADYSQRSSGGPPAYRPTVPEGISSVASDSRKTMIENVTTGSGTPSTTKSPVFASSPQLDSGVPMPRKTTFYPPPKAEAGGVQSTSATQKIVAVLVTYSWKPEGQIFPIREGRNRIGRSSAECDILIPQDETMSAIHCSITFRTRFVISDNDTMSGTFVNEIAVEEKSYPLDNYDRIRMGSTVWTLVVLQPPTAKAD